MSGVVGADETAFYNTGRAQIFQRHPESLQGGLHVAKRDGNA